MASRGGVLEDAMATSADDLARFHWEPQPEAQALLDGMVGGFLERSPMGRSLKRRMLEETATRFFDWIDHLGLPDADGLGDRLAGVGYEEVEREGVGAAHGGTRVMVHPGALFPAVVLHREPVVSVGLKVDSVVDFANAHRVPSANALLGAPGSRLRMLLCERSEPASGGASVEDPRAELWAVERLGYDGFLPGERDAERAMKVAEHRERMVRRDRDFSARTGDFTVGGEADRMAFEALNGILDRAIEDLGRDAACELFFEGERVYWETFNRAAQIQHLRQNRLGLGWANHDHHTYRVSRANYAEVIAVFEKLGFHCRERFYAGEEAGWGAQVLEQPRTGIVIFADVDMSPEELTGDFAHEGFATAGVERGYSTVGMWVALHGEAIHQAGMHHLECMFDHAALREQLKEEAGIETMEPFTAFPYLRQAFTEGEVFPVNPGRIDALVAAGAIDEQQASRFREGGALGSHLENLERNDGFKGFNQQGVSDIIARTDPRKQELAAG